MTSYYEVFEVEPNVEEVGGDSERDQEAGGSHGGWWSQGSPSTPAWEQPSRGSWQTYGSWRWSPGYGGRHYTNWSWDGQSDCGSVGSWRSYDNWSWGNGGGSGERERHGRGQGRVPGAGGRGGDGSLQSSPRSPPAAGYDRESNAPSGEVTSAGNGPGPREPGGSDATEEKKVKGRASNSYPPIFRAKPGESYRDWRRSVDFWLGGEGHQIPMEYVGPRIMVQLRDRAAQLVKHLNNSDVNTVDGMQKIFAVLERSPLVKQLDKHRIDQHRKRLMALNRFLGESLESYITRGNIYRNQLVGLDSTLEMGEKFYVGHLLDHAKLTRRDKALVRTRAGEDTEEAVTNAMVELAAELEGEQGCPMLAEVGPSTSTWWPVDTLQL